MILLDIRIKGYKGVSFDKESEMYRYLIERIKYNILYIVDYRNLLPVYNVKTRKALIEAIATDFIEFTKKIPDRRISLPIEFDIIQSMKFKKYNVLSRSLARTLFSYLNSPRGIRVQKRNGMIFPFKVNDYYPLFEKLLNEYSEYKKNLLHGRTLEKSENGYYQIVEKRILKGEEYIITYDRYTGQDATIEDFIRENSAGNLDYGFVESITEYFYVWDIDMLEESLKE